LADNDGDRMQVTTAPQYSDYGAINPQ